MGKKNATPNDIVLRVNELRKTINDADYHYYALSNPIMSDKEYDNLYYELMLLERDYPNMRSDTSPTMRVGSDLIDGFEKSEHIVPMLSMDKIKADDFRKKTAIKNFVKKVIDASSLEIGELGFTGQWKCDGLTLVLTYKKGKLVKAVTRGDGYVGDVVTVNAKTIRNIPLELNKKIDIVIRGEAMISKSEFVKINEKMVANGLKPYANARNLASGSLKSFDPKVCSERRLMFFAYDVIDYDTSCEYDELDFEPVNLLDDEYWLRFLKELHFTVVPYAHVDYNVKSFENYVNDIEFDIDKFDYAIDGVIFKCNDLNSRKVLGNGNKYPNWAFAYKFDDDVFETKLVDIEWDVSRTRRINPVAIFEPVVIDGTIVDRATLNNPDYISDLQLGIGDKIGVIKANMIIPNVVENYSKSATYKLPTECPICGSQTKRKGSYMYCTNIKCYGANLKRFNHFCSKGAMNIKGLSNSKLFDLLENDVISEYYHLYDGTIWKKKETILALDGWGKTSFANLYKSIDESKHTTLPRFLYSLGIPNIGYESAVSLCEYVDYEPLKLLELTYDDVISIDGFGDKTTRLFIKYIQSKRIVRIISRFVRSKLLVFENEFVDVKSNALEGMVFCITGKLSKPRDFFADDIISNGGDYTSSIKKNTTHLLYGSDAGSKLEKAKEKGLVLVSESEYIKLKEGND